jgi:DUF4097 and DUF4098 domain-containing protein YvlB
MRLAPVHHGLPALLLAALVFASPAAAQDFNWRGSLQSGRTLEVKGINGSIRATAASGSEARVTAVRTEGRRGNAEDVRIEVVEHSGGVTICALYPPGRDGRENTCAPGSGGRMNSNNNDVKVEFRVEVPAGVHFSGRNVNGQVIARSLSGNVSAYTVNGAVEVEATGLVRAGTVNGALDVSMGRSDWDGELELETVNGGITVTFTGDLNAEVTASTVNGSISTDYPLTVQGRFGPKRLRGTVGSGGRELVLSTVNGGIEIRKR